MPVEFQVKPFRSQWNKESLSYSTEEPTLFRVARAETLVNNGYFATDYG
ncbi:18703_t:CDS:2 [Dentiscutata erythropus]|uniref:18703_t:CDS:1 n=1 Tax=Dentiscutata erythropus TaxID=1348616 RepID=A0A9N8VST1_9GLOM|nr:18703_t:CDS:2 [Dentiscutata erythropus]